MMSFYTLEMAIRSFPISRDNVKQTERDEWANWPTNNERTYPMKRFLTTSLAAAALISLVSAPSFAVCSASAPTVSCSSSPCLQFGTTAWQIDWYDQSSCGCDQITIFADQDCDGGWVQIATVGCNETSFTYCGDASSDYRFKIVYSNGGVQTVDDIVTSCLDCP